MKIAKILLFSAFLAMPMMVSAQKSSKSASEPPVVTSKTVAPKSTDATRTNIEKQAKAGNSAIKDLKAIDTGDKAWKFSGTIGLTAANTSFVNWAAGGNDNINGTLSTKLRLLYHKDNVAWDTHLNMEYGATWIDQKYDQFQKKSDNIDFATKFGWEFKKTWYLTVLAGFQSQFAYGRKYSASAAYDPIASKWLAPSYTDISVGIDWKYNDFFSLYLSPVAGRITTVYVSDYSNNRINKEVEDFNKNISNPEAEEYNQKETHPYQVKDDEGNVIAEDFRTAMKDKYAVWRYDENGNKDYSKNLYPEVGMSFKAMLDYKYKNIRVTSTLGLFTPYSWDKTVMGLSANGCPLYRDNNRRFGNFDVDWDTSFSCQFFNCLQITVSTSLKYVNGTMISNTWEGADGVEVTQKAERVQFKDVVGIGVGYSF